MDERFQIMWRVVFFGLVILAVVSFQVQLMRNRNGYSIHELAFWSVVNGVIIGVFSLLIGLMVDWL